MGICREFRSMHGDRTAMPGKEKRFGLRCFRWRGDPQRGRNHHTFRFIGLLKTAFIAVCPVPVFGGRVGRQMRIQENNAVPVQNPFARVIGVCRGVYSESAQRNDQY